MIHPADVPALARLGVRVVLSAVEPSEKTLFALHEAGIFQFSVPMGATFRHSRTILDVVDHFAPEQVFIHCRHGADRTGAIAAFLLVVRHDWTIADAFYSVLYASQPDVDGLAEVLAQFAITDHRSIDDPSVGFYSVAAAGGVGGLKTRNRRYAQMVSTTVEAIQGIRLAEQGQTACPTPVVPSMVTTP